MNAYPPVWYKGYPTGSAEANNCKQLMAVRFGKWKCFLSTIFDLGKHMELFVAKIVFF